jgi:hypothetical protein
MTLKLLFEVCLILRRCETSEAFAIEWQDSSYSIPSRFID